MQITPPFGYREVVPFLKTQKVRSVPEFVQRGNAIPISHTEFQLVGRDYPIVFASSDGGKNFAAVAVVGISAGENLFYSDAWARNVYVPAYARRYPFCMAKVTLDKVEQKNRLICIEKSSIDEDSGEAMFDAAGQASERWTQLEHLLTEYETDLERSREMCALAQRLRPARAFHHAGNAQQGQGRRRDASHRHAPDRREEPREPQRRAAEEPDAQRAARAHLHAPAFARQLRAPAREEGFSNHRSGKPYKRLKPGSRWTTMHSRLSSLEAIRRAGAQIANQGEPR